MTNRFYRPGAQRAVKVHELFATIARRYDLLNDLMSAGLHRRWKRRLVARALAGCRVVEDTPHPASRTERDAGLSPKGRGVFDQRLPNNHTPAQSPLPNEGEAGPVSFTGTGEGGAAPRPYGHRLSQLRVLDLCCGTGDLARYFARHPAARICGADFTTEMLRVAATRPIAADWIQADALRLPFAAESFDVVSVGYGLRNLADLPQGLREIFRVLRPGGQLVALDFGKPASAVWRRLYFFWLRTTLPLLGWAFCGDPDTHGYILASLEPYPAQRGLGALMQQCGYADCGFEEFLGGAMAINFGRKTPRPLA